MSNKKKFQLFIVNNISWVLIVVFYIFFATLKPEGMLKLSTISFMIYSAVPMGFIVIGVALNLLIGCMDLSLAQMTGFAAMLSALIITKWIPGIPPILQVFIPIVIGILGGALNGYMVAYMKLNPFLVTLGAFMAYEGGTLLLQPYPIYEGFSDYYLVFGGNGVVSIIVFIVIILIMSLILKYSSLGLHIYGVGGNYMSAKMVGVNPKRVQFIVFSIAGAFAGLSGLFYTGYLDSVPPSMADGNIFLAFAGAIIGGVEQEGGRGSMINVLAGIIFLALIEAGLSMFNVNPYLRRVVYGILVIVAILINKFRNQVRDMILQTE